MTTFSMADVGLNRGPKQSGHGVFNVKITKTVTISMKDTKNMLN